MLSDGRDALMHAMNERFDVMVIDRMLPGLDGLSLVKALRASGNTTPVLFMSQQRNARKGRERANGGSQRHKPQVVLVKQGGEYGLHHGLA